MVTTPRKMTDLRHVDTGLSAEQRIDALNECKLFRSLRQLGKHWLLHPEYSGHYIPELHSSNATRTL